MLTPALPERVRPQDAVLFYDGLCGFCDGTVRWLLQHDRGGRLYFVPQQSQLAQAVFAQHALHAIEDSSVYLLIQPGTESAGLLKQSDAIVRALGLLGGPWPALAALVRVVPRRLRDAVYAAIARNRYRIAGRRMACRIPTPEERSRFLDG